MKKIIFVIIKLLTTILLSRDLNAQISLENTYNLQTGQESLFLTDLGNYNFKYVIFDYYNDKFSLYNIDNTPFILNVTIPVSTDSGQAYSIGYITNSLFDCDSVTIEYAIMSPSPRDTMTFYIFRTDGTLVFSRDSVTVPWGLGYNVGSVYIHGITNTNGGTKLVLFNNHLQFFVYSLCGELPANIIETNYLNNYVKLFPIPNSGQINFNITPPDNINSYELVIFNSSYQVIKSTLIEGHQKLLMDNLNFSSGVYFYSLKNKNKVFQSGKFVITK